MRTLETDTSPFFFRASALGTSSGVNMLFPESKKRVDGSFSLNRFSDREELQLSGMWYGKKMWVSLFLHLLCKFE